MKVLCVLYDDPVNGYPPAYARDGIPTIEGYHGGQTTPTPEAIDFTPGELLGSVSGELGLRKFLEAVSILGEILAVRAGRDGGRLQASKGRIHAGCDEPLGRRNGLTIRRRCSGSSRRRPSLSPGRARQRGCRPWPPSR